MEIIGYPQSWVQLCAKLDMDHKKLPPLGEFRAAGFAAAFILELVDGKEMSPQLEAIVRGAQGELELATGLAMFMRNEPGYLIQGIDIPHKGTCVKPDHILLHPKMLATIESKYWRAGQYHPQYKEFLKRLNQQMTDARKAVHVTLYTRTDARYKIRVTPIVFNPTGTILKEDLDKAGGVLIRSAQTVDWIADGIVREGEQDYTPEQIEEFKETLARLPAFVPESCRPSGITTYEDIAGDDFPSWETINSFPHPTEE